MQLFNFNFKALGGLNNIQFYCDDSFSAENIKEEIVACVSAIEMKFSRYLAESVVSKINSKAGQNEAIEVDEETSLLIDYAAMCHEQSEGLFDITSGILRKAWNFSEPKLPSPELIRELLDNTGWDKVEWKKPFFRLRQKGMEIDFGGFGKEYAVDKAIDLAQKLGIKHGLINLGGDVRAIGSHFSGKPWTIGIAHPRNKDSIATSFTISHGAIASSGDYERFIEIDGKRYCHILNPKTGWPVQDMQSVSVFSESCLIAGTAATIAMLFGEIKGRRFLKDLGLKSYQINSSGKIYSD